MRRAARLRAAAALAAGGCATLAALAFPTITLTEADVQRRVVERFPITRAMPLGMTLTLANPVVDLGDPGGRGGLLADATLALPGGRRYAGQADVSGSVRFDRTQGQFLLDAPRLDALRVPGLPESWAGTARSVANAAVAAAVQSLPLYTLTDEDFAQSYAKRHLKSVQVRDRRLVLDFD